MRGFIACAVSRSRRAQRARAAGGAGSRVGDASASDVAADAASAPEFRFLLLASP